MSDLSINQIRDLNSGVSNIAASEMLGTQFTKVELSSVKADLEQLQKTFTFKGLERIDKLLEQTKQMATAKELSEEAKKNLRELVEKLKKAAERFGLRLELDNNKAGQPLVRVYNRLNNRQMTTIPLHVLLKMLVSVRTPSGTLSGTPGQEFAPELIDNGAQNIASDISTLAQTNIII
jgi:hypothetical protein